MLPFILQFSSFCIVSCPLPPTDVFCPPGRNRLLSPSLCLVGVEIAWDSESCRRGLKYKSLPCDLEADQFSEL